MDGVARVLTIAAVVGLAGCTTVSPREDVPVARTDAGKVGGVAKEGVQVYRGIPFAAPPVGKLRWRSPKPAPRWQGIRTASAFGPACPQGQLPPPFGVQGSQSEDCLTLNIWAPADARQRSLKPVMFWLHGGAFLFGSGSQAAYHAEELARKGLVVVTSNYRLGALGFLAHPALSAEQAGGPLGNYGLEDQLEALRWVNRNIRAFGGDPANVTLFGESAGGVSVQALMATPAAHGLFSKAISQSGGGAAVFLRAGRGGAADSQGEQWAKAAGLVNASAEQLRSLPVPKILSTPFLSFPHVDGQLLRMSPGDAFDRGLQARVPLIIGSNSFEASLTGLDDELAQMTLGARYQVLAGAYGRQFAGDPSAGQELRGDLFFVAPSMFVARRHSAVGAPTWHYHFNWLPASARGKRPGAPHGGELAYVFGKPEAWTMTWDGADRRVSRWMLGSWAAFARTGDPNGTSRSVWARTNPHRLATMSIGTNMTMVRPRPLTELMEQAAVDAARQEWRK